MKFKKLYSSQIKNSVTQKLISSSLAVGLMLNSVSISFAGILSDDGRYETFEGSSITINDILEEGEVDVEVEGNTLINVLNLNKIIRNDGWTYNVDERRGYVNLVSSSNAWTELNFDTDKNIELGKEYTVFINVTKNTLVRNDGSSSDRVVKMAISSDTGDDNVFFIKRNQTGIIKHVITPSESILRKPYISIIPNVGYGEFEFKDFMVVEGNHVDKDIDFFEGMKSVGERDGKIDIISKNKNLLPDSNGWIDGQLYVDGIVNANPVYTASSISTKDYIRLSGGKSYIFSYPDTYNVAYHTWDINYNYIKDSGWINNKTITPAEDCYIKVTVRRVDSYDGTLETAEANPTYPSHIGNELKIQLEEGVNATSYINSSTDKKEVLLNEPLRSLPNGIKDRIIKRNGQWVVERNCGEAILDGSEDWHISSISSWKKQVYYTNYPNALNTNNHSVPHTKNNRLKDVSPNSLVNTDEYGVSLWVLGGTPCFLMDIENVSNVNELKQWLSKNPVTIVYPVKDTVYEPLNIDTTLSLYLDTTHISNNSTIPANMKVTVDRAINRAVKAIELAKTNPTISNISEARYWTNLLKESIKKDELQSEINSITDIEDLQLEKKTATANMDVYIKSENALSLSLSSNSITFKDFNGTEDLELNGVIEMTVDSSLPYEINAYLEEEIQNADKTAIMDKQILNLKESGTNDYKVFTDIKTKLTLISNSDAGNNKIHSFDFKLNGGIAHKKDVYKTTIKFEAIQK